MSTAGCMRYSATVPVHKARVYARAAQRLTARAVTEWRTGGQGQPLKWYMACNPREETRNTPMLYLRLYCA